MNTQLNKRLFLSFSICFLAQGFFAQKSYSQSLDFVTSDYDMLSVMSEDYFRYKSDNKVGILTRDGAKVKEWTADYITSFDDGMALVLVNRNGHYRIHRMIDVDMLEVSPSSDIFVDSYPFFSGGYLPVYTKQDKKTYGFIDRHGTFALNELYKAIRPCYNDKALVKMFENKNKKKEEKWTEVSFSALGQTITNSIAGLVGVNKVSVSEANEEYYDLCEDKKDIRTYIDIYHYPLEGNGPEAFQDGISGYYGYMDKAGEVIIPAQFSYASDFYNGRAVVQFPDGKYRIVKLLEGKTLLSSTLISNSNGYETYRFNVSLPRAIQAKVDETPSALSVRCVSDKSEKAEMKGKNSYELKTQSKAKNVEVLYNGLILLRQNLEAGSVELVGLKLSASRTSVRANMNDSATVKFTVTNPSSSNVEFNISSSGKSATLSNKSMSVSPNGSVSFTASYKDIDSNSSSKVSISGDRVSPTSVTIYLSTYF